MADALPHPTPGPLRVLVLEPYYGGSHRAFLDTLAAHSRHTFELLTLPARKWKWRMRGAAIWFADQVNERSAGDFDAMLTCDMLSVTDLRALIDPAWRLLPVVCYFHENQLTYPLSDDDWRDYQFGVTNITSVLAADAVWFNSSAHRAAFLAAGRDFLAQMPDFVPDNLPDRLERANAVYWPPVQPPRADFFTDRDASPPLTILWNHRWEYDKNPEPFFETLFALLDDGLDFRLALLGESFRVAPEVFGQAWARLEPHLVRAGFANDRREYWGWLAASDIVVSTAIQENFGIAMVEAMLAGCWPLAPDRLSYPEIIPPEAHADCLYRDDAELPERLRPLLTGGIPGARRRWLREKVARRHDLSYHVSVLDAALAEVVAKHRHGT